MALYILELVCKHLTKVEKILHQCTLQDISYDCRICLMNEQTLVIYDHDHDGSVRFSLLS